MKATATTCFFAISFVGMLATGCATSATTAAFTAMPEATSPGYSTTSELHSLSDDLLNTRQAELSRFHGLLVSEARSAVERRQHRIAYLKYSDIKTVLGSAIHVLEEVKRRQPQLHERVRIARRIDKVRVQVFEVNKMLGLLRFSATAARS
jgi:hypothetical protein